MSGNLAQRVTVALTPDEARLVVAALRQYEPYWPSGTDEATRRKLLADIRGAIDRIAAALAW